MRHTLSLLCTVAALAVPHAAPAQPAGDETTVATVNGEAWTEGNTAGMLYSFEELIASLSRGETIHAGEFIGSGTVENGCGLEMNRFLDKGDRLALEIERIGTLHCSVSTA